MISSLNIFSKKSLKTLFACSAVSSLLVLPALAESSSTDTSNAFVNPTCPNGVCRFSIWAGPKFFFPTGSTRGYVQNVTPSFTIGAAKPVYQITNRTNLNFGMVVDSFGYSSKALGPNLSASVTDQTSNNDALYSFSNIMAFVGIEYYFCRYLTAFFDVGPEFQNRSFVIQNSTSTQPADFIVSNTLGVEATVGFRTLFPVTNSFTFFLRPSGTLNWGPSVPKNLAFQATAGVSQIVEINPVSFAISISAGGEF